MVSENIIENTEFWRKKQVLILYSINVFKKYDQYEKSYRGFIYSFAVNLRTLLRNLRAKKRGRSSPKLKKIKSLHKLFQNENNRFYISNTILEKQVSNIRAYIRRTKFSENIEIAALSLYKKISFRVSLDFRSAITL